MSLAEMEDSLLRNLFKGYQKWVRPVQHANDTITVRFGLKISQLVDVVRRRHPNTHTHRGGMKLVDGLVTVDGPLQLFYPSLMSQFVQD